MYIRNTFIQLFQQMTDIGCLRAFPIDKSKFTTFQYGFESKVHFLCKVLCGVIHRMDRLASIQVIQDEFRFRIICGNDSIHIGIQENRSRWREELWVQSNEKNQSTTSHVPGTMCPTCCELIHTSRGSLGQIRFDKSPWFSMALVSDRLSASTRFRKLPVVHPRSAFFLHLQYLE